MAYEYAKQVDNVYMIDTMMFGFDRFQSSFLVAGNEIALIDTGAPRSLDVVRAAIGERGFAVADISHIFVTHGEHPDHSGNVGALLKETQKAKVYLAAPGAEYLTNPEIEAATRKANLSARMAERFGEMVPVPPSRLEYVKEGDVVDLGNGERLKVMITPGHQPSGIVVLEEKNMGLFVNDLTGAYFADADASFIFTPFRSDVRQYRESLIRVRDLPLRHLYLGHFGISDSPRAVFENALRKIEQLLDIASRYKGPEDRETIVREAMTVRMVEAEKIRKVRGAEDLYQYLSRELIPSMSHAFGAYCAGGMLS
jgi:glyoxylase-like metal-dependent hydrolase (beta-lactamase superfamily II)